MKSKTKIIIRTPEISIERANKLMDSIKDSEIAVIPKNIDLLIKNKDGYWEELNEKN